MSRIFRRLLFSFLDSLLPELMGLELLRGALARKILGFRTATKLRLRRGVDFGSTFEHITIGPNCYIGSNSSFNTWSAPIVVGANVSIGTQSIVWTGSHEIGDETNRCGPGTHYPIEIGSGTWIGLRATIHRNIGKGCIIESGSLVLMDITDNSYAGCASARKIKTLPISDVPEPSEPELSAN